MTKTAILALLNQNDFGWLRQRLAVITFEECWGYGCEVTFQKDVDQITKHLVKLATTVKNKGAAGLGSLAYELSRGDTSTLEGNASDRLVKIIAEAVKRPADFWSWIRSQASDESTHSFVENAYEAFKKVGWPWDRAFTQAAALLALETGVPTVKYCREDLSDECPVWVGIDKHTLEGRKAIKLVASEIGINVNKAMWIAFYVESAKCKEMDESHWWLRERKWRLNKFGLTLEDAIAYWSRMSPRIQELLVADVQSNSERIRTLACELPPQQESLLSNHAIN